MLNKERIENNPYRVLGIYVGNPKSVEVSHLNKIRAFSNVGQTFSVTLRGDDILQPIVRTQESADAAAQTLSLAKDRIENSLLWFSDGTKDWGVVLNDAVQALLENDYTKAINSYEKLISDDFLRKDFLEASTHGLLTLSKEELANLISELISSCEDNLEEYWMSGSGIPSGLIATTLFENTIPIKLESLIQSIEYYNPQGIDFYEYINQLESTLTEIKPLLEKVGYMYGVDSMRYKSNAEEICKKTYIRGTYLIKQIGEFVWLQGNKYRLRDNTYKKYRSKMPVGCIRACMDLISRVDSVVVDMINWTHIDNTSQRILYSEIYSYLSTKQIEFVDNDDIIHRSVRSFYIKRGLTIAAWLLFLYWMFFII